MIAIPDTLIRERIHIFHSCLCQKRVNIHIFLIEADAYGIFRNKYVSVDGLTN